MSRFIDLTRQRFGRLTVVQRAETDKRGHAIWLCRCDCGNKTVVPGSVLRQGATQSCGCFRSEIARNRITTQTRMEGKQPAYIGYGTA